MGKISKAERILLRRLKRLMDHNEGYYIVLKPIENEWILLAGRSKHNEELALKLAARLMEGS